MLPPRAHPVEHRVQGGLVGVLGHGRVLAALVAGQARDDHHVAAAREHRRDRGTSAGSGRCPGGSARARTAPPGTARSPRAAARSRRHRRGSGRRSAGRPAHRRPARASGRPRRRARAPAAATRSGSWPVVGPGCRPPRPVWPRPIACVDAQLTLAERGTVHRARQLRAPERADAQGRPRRHRRVLLRQAGVDGRLPGRRRLQLPGQRRRRQDVQEGLHRRGHVPDEGLGQRRRLPGPGRRRDLHRPPRGRERHRQRLQHPRVREHPDLGHQPGRGRLHAQRRPVQHDVHRDRCTGRDRVRDPGGPAGRRADLRRHAGGGALVDAR